LKKNITGIRPALSPARTSVHPGNRNAGPDGFCKNILRFISLAAPALCLMMLTLPANSRAQSKITTVHIAGKVVAAKTGSPLAGAKAYLGNTTFGTVTDANGSYILKNIPLGTYEIVVSGSGYEPQTRQITLKAVTEYSLDFALQPLNMAGLRPEDISDKPEDWGEHYQQFLDYFIGPDEPMASHCRILNPEQLNLTYDPLSKTLIANSGRANLLLENRWLGYKVEIRLQQFRYRGFGNGSQLFVTRFSELAPQNELEKKEWTQHRLLAYYGSVRHFLRSLTTATMEREGFVVKNADKTTRAHGQEVAEPMLDQNMVTYDSLNQNWILTFHNKIVANYSPNATARHQLKGSDPKLMALKMNPFYLQVTGRDSLRLNALGIVDKPMHLSVMNNWSYLSFAFRLPLDYTPDAPAVLANEQTAQAQRRYPVKEQLQPLLEYLSECANHFEDQLFFSSNRDKLDDLNDALGDLTKHDPDDPMLHYLQGICERELGVKAPTLARLHNWPSAEKHFKKAIELDSTFQDAYYQWALVRKYRGDYDGAVDLALRQQRMNRRCKSGAIGIYSLLDVLLHHASLAELESRFAGRSAEFDRFALAQVLRRQGRLEKADSMFDALAQNPGAVALPAILLARVRLYTEKGEPLKAQHAYMQAIESVTDDISARFLLNDFFPIAHRSEYQLLSQELDPETLRYALRQVWLDRDPAPASAYNRRLTEHYNRLLHADAHYRYDELRHRSFRDLNAKEIEYPPWFEINTTLCDRGMIYLRFGKPDEEVRRDVADKNTMSWLYQANGYRPKMIYHFVNARNAPTNYWVMTTGFHEKEIVEDMVHWDRVYQLQAMNKNEQAYEEMRENRLETVDFSFRNDSHAFSADVKPLPFFYAWLTFHESDQQDLLQVEYSLPLPETLPLLPESVRQVEVGLVVMDEGRTQVFKKTDSIAVRNPALLNRFHGQAIGQFEVPLRRKDYVVRLHAISDDERFVFTWQQTISCRDTLKHRLSCSPLKLAYNIEPRSGAGSRFRKDIDVIPNPSGQYHTFDPLFVYYEIYNLSLDANGRSDYAIEFSVNQKNKKKNLLDKMADAFKEGKKSEVATKYGRAGKRINESNYYLLDISRLKPGDYDLMLRISDNRSGEFAEAKTGFEIVK
jgi:tetratricopeptide (TPR) repeat protein